MGAALLAVGIELLIGIGIGLIVTVIGLFFGNIIVFDSIALAILAGFLSHGLLGVHPALAIVIGITVLLGLLLLHRTRPGFWLIGGVLSVVWGFFIDVASIPGVGPARKAALRSFGIETAADVTRRGVKQVKGFGDHLTQAVIDWKASCERRFVFRPNEAITPADRQAVMAKMTAKRHRLESTLTVGATELQRFRLHAPARTMPLMEPLRQAAEKLAQAQADLSRC